MLLMSFMAMGISSNKANAINVNLIHIAFDVSHGNVNQIKKSMSVNIIYVNLIHIALTINHYNVSQIEHINVS